MRKSKLDDLIPANWAGYTRIRDKNLWERIPGGMVRKTNPNKDRNWLDETLGTGE